MEVTPLQETDVERFIDELWVPAQREMATLGEYTLLDDIRQDGLSHRRSRLAEDDVVTYLARRENELVGYVAAEIGTPPPIFEQERECHISELFVGEDARRQGVATDLLGAIEQWAIANECTRMNLNVDTENQPAKTLYEREGYEVTRYNMKKNLAET